MTALPSAVTRLLRTHIDSVEKLDLLLALGSAPERSASLAVLARLTQLPPGVTRRLAGELETAGLVILDPVRGPRLFPSRNSDREALDELIQCNEHDREAVLNALMGRPGGGTPDRDP